MQAQIVDDVTKKVFKESIFIVAADAPAKRSLTSALSRLGYQVSEFRSTSVLLHGLREQAPPVAVTFELGTGTEEDFKALEELAEKLRPLPVIALSSQAVPAKIVRAVRVGAASFLLRPFTGNDVRKAIATALEMRRDWAIPSRNSTVTSKHNPKTFVCASPKMRSLEEMARRVADTDVTILLTGESGSGKEVIARYIHRCSARAMAPFVKVNCAALPEQLLESELFGYEKGAFTGADTSKPGRFEAADRGTIFLDEITETSARLQAKFLQVLQDNQFTHLGGNRDVTVDVRVLVATNRELEIEVDQGRFREDLYFRLKVIDLYVPPLRERREEIPLLIDHFRHRFALQYHRPVPDLSEKLLNLLVNNRWTGNVRELENVMKRVVILDDERSITQELLRKGNYGVRTKPPDTPLAESDELEVAEGMSLKKVGEHAARAAERTLIASTLERTRWNRLRASRMLGVSYKTLLTKMTKCGLSEG